jgi:hypothetical protein
MWRERENRVSRFGRSKESLSYTYFLRLPPLGGEGWGGGRRHDGFINWFAFTPP